MPNRLPFTPLHPYPPISPRDSTRHTAPPPSTHRNRSCGIQHSPTPHPYPPPRRPNHNTHSHRDLEHQPVTPYPAMQAHNHVHNTPKQSTLPRTPHLPRKPQRPAQTPAPCPLHCPHRSHLTHHTGPTFLPRCPPTRPQHSTHPTLQPSHHYSIRTPHNTDTPTPLPPHHTAARSYLHTPARPTHPPTTRHRPPP